MQEAKMDPISQDEPALFQNITHLDSQIDVKPKFKLQIEDRDKMTGEYLFQPTFHEHHRSYMRDHFQPEIIRPD